MACLGISGVLNMNQTAVIEVLTGLVVYLLFEAGVVA
jgi:hypothetical protein